MRTILILVSLFTLTAKAQWTYPPKWKAQENLELLAYTLDSLNFPIYALVINNQSQVEIWFYYHQYWEPLYIREHMMDEEGHFAGCSYLFATDQLSEIQNKTGFIQFVSLWDWYYKQAQVLTDESLLKKYKIDPKWLTK